MTHEQDPVGATQLVDPEAGLFSVSITDDDQREMNAVDIALEYRRGTLDLEDTFVWQEGWDDWLPLGQVPALVDMIRQSEAAVPSGQGSGPGYAPPSPFQPEEPDEATVMLAPSDPGAADPGGAIPPAAGSGAARADAGQPMEDVFAARARSQPPGALDDRDRRLGERNEASALFNINDIHAAAAARSQPAVAAPDSFDDDDLMKLGGGGGGFGAMSADAFSAPPLNAPPPPEPEPPPQPIQAQPAAQVMAAAALMEPQQKKSRAGLIVAALLGVAVCAVLIVYFVTRSPDTGPTASADATADEGDEKPGDDSSGDDKDPDSTGSDSDTSTASGDETGDDPDKGDKKDPDKPATAVGSPSDPVKKDDPKKDDPKKDDPKKEDPKDDPPPSDAPKAEFSRDAARAALNSAAGRAAGCKQADGPTGRGRVSVTFAPSGVATQAIVGPPFAGTSVGSCAAGAFRSCRVPPFTGGAVTVTKSFFIK